MTNFGRGEVGRNQPKMYLLIDFYLANLTFSVKIGSLIVLSFCTLRSWTTLPILFHTIHHLKKPHHYINFYGWEYIFFPIVNFVTIGIFVLAKIVKLLKRWHYAYYIAQYWLHNLFELSPVCCKRQTLGKFNVIHLM